MSGSVNTYAPSMQMQMESSAVSLASGPIMLSECKQAILRAGGTWPPDGTRITSDHNASRATFTDTENSGFLDAISMASSKEELKRLCDERTNLENTRLLNSTSWQSIIEDNTSTWRRINGLSKDQATRVWRLRKRRIELLHWFDSVRVDYLDVSKAPNYHRHHVELKQIQEELYALTGINQYQI